VAGGWCDGHAARVQHAGLERGSGATPCTGLQSRLIKIGARVVHHARAITFQLAEVGVNADLFNRILAAIHRLRAPSVLP
jgi:hypothetical protein